MKTIFILNPKAGKAKACQRLIDEINKAGEQLGVPVEIYKTKARGDATRFARSYCEKYGAARFIACGGDGTLCEVVNGIINFPEAQVGVMPLGTGNDFRRNFKETKEFSSPRAQLLGEALRVDAIRYESKEKKGYCLNMVNIGFDCHVVDMTDKLKKTGFISGSLAYFLAIFIMLIKKKGAKLIIKTNGVKNFEGKLLLTAIANGKFCGGGIKSNPCADLCDGKIDMNIVYNISRLNFVSKLIYYMKGTHIKLKNIEKVICNQKCTQAVITPQEGTMRVCVDGEVLEMGETTFTVVPESVNFVLPRK